MENQIKVKVALIILCGWNNYVSSSDVVRFDVDMPVMMYVSDADEDSLDMLDDSFLEELHDEEPVGLPEVLSVPSYEEDNGLDLSRLGDRGLGDLGGGMFIDIEPLFQTELVDSNATIVVHDESEEDEDSDSSSASDSDEDFALLPTHNRLGDWRKTSDRTLSYLDLGEYDDSSENMLSPQNEFSPESPLAIVDVRTASLAVSALKARILRAKRLNFQNQIERLNRLENMFEQHIVSLSWFVKEFEKMRIAFDAVR